MNDIYLADIYLVIWLLIAAGIFAMIIISLAKQAMRNAQKRKVAAMIREAERRG